jgi:Fur family zinc uptake transcriptional regulator
MSNRLGLPYGIWSAIGGTFVTAEFSRRTKGLLHRAHGVCQQRGAKLTELRRLVLGLILDSASPSGAYELLDRLRQTRRSAAPPTVYRALDFLLDQGLIHKVERLSAFVACVAGCTAGPDEKLHTETVQFLICHGCGRVIEMRNHDVSAVLQAAAKQVRFRISNVTIEAQGVCSTCDDAVAARARATDGVA